MNYLSLTNGSDELKIASSNDKKSRPHMLKLYRHYQKKVALLKRSIINLI